MGVRFPLVLLQVRLTVGREVLSLVIRVRALDLDLQQAVGSPGGLTREHLARELNSSCRGVAPPGE